MAPPSAATAAPSRRHAAVPAGTTLPSRPRSREDAAPARRAPLRLVPPRTRRADRGGRVAGRGRLLYGIAIAMVLVSLLAVVVGQALLANGQVRLSRLQHALSLEQSAHRESELAVAQLETPARIVGSATVQLHMVRPASVIELPYVSLSVPLPTPQVTSAPASSSTTAPTASGSAGTSSTTGSASATSTP